MAVMNQALNESVFGPALSPWTSPLYVRLYDGDVVQQPIATGVIYHGSGASAQVDFVFGDVELTPYADNNAGRFGTITGDLESENSWSSNITASQVYDDMRVEEGNFSSYTVYGSVGGYVDVTDTRNTTVSLGKSDDVYTAGNDDVGLNIMDGRGGHFDIWDSDNTRLGIVSAEDAYVRIADSTMTEVHTGFGDVTVFDGGTDSKIRLGSGDDYVTLAAKEGQTLLNTGAGNDAVYKTGDADAIIKFGDDYDRFDLSSLKGDTVLLDSPESGRVHFGNSDAELYDLMQIFGENQGGDAVLEFNGGGELAIINAAAEFGIGQVVDDMDLGKG